MADIWPASEQDALDKIVELTERETKAIEEGKN